ncbi:hypothetical protein TcCL_ESM08629 [Trypanosoma cruzi]|nr:hypothetical protein TcCL_ESM08629 [Trypanosoma cruzi]
MRIRGLREAAFLRKHAAEGVDGVAPVRCCAAVRGILSFDISSCFFNILHPRLSCSHDPAGVPPYAPKVRQERPRKLPEKELACLGAASPAPAMLATDASMHGWSGLLLWGRGNCWRLAGTGAKRNSPADEAPMGSPLVEFCCPTCGFQH